MLMVVDIIYLYFNIVFQCRGINTTNKTATFLHTFTPYLGLHTNNITLYVALIKQRSKAPTVECGHILSLLNKALVMWTVNIYDVYSGKGNLEITKSNIDIQI